MAHLTKFNTKAEYDTNISSNANAELPNVSLIAQGSKIYYTRKPKTNIVFSGSTTQSGLDVFPSTENIKNAWVNGELTFNNGVGSIKIPTLSTNGNFNVTIERTNRFSGITFNGTTAKVVEVEPNILNGLTEIPAYTFNSQKIASFTIKNNVAEIGKQAFMSCHDLKKITFENESNLRIIGIESFNDCRALESIELPESLAAIKQNAFLNCPVLKAIRVKAPNHTFGLTLYSGVFKGCGSLEYIRFYGPAPIFDENATAVNVFEGTKGGVIYCPKEHFDTYRTRFNAILGSPSEGKWRLSQF